jgi:hypothetical protein
MVRLTETHSSPSNDSQRVMTFRALPAGASSLKTASTKMTEVKPIVLTETTSITIAPCRAKRTLVNTPTTLSVAF